MDSHNNEKMESLEDQLRRMIVSNGSSAPENVGPQARPTVRLPPSGFNPHNQQRQTLGLPPQSPHAAANGHGNPRNIVPPQTASSPYNAVPGQAPPSSRTAPMNRQNQRQRRMQPQGQTGPPNDAYGPPPSSYGPRQQGRFQPHHPAQTSNDVRQPQIDPDAFQRGGRVAGYYQQPSAQPRQLFNPNAPRGPPPSMQPDYRSRQTQYLGQMAATEVPNVEMSQAERDEKEAFRGALQNVIREVCAADPERLPVVSLECFGSFKSGFASAGSDMDLVIVLQDGTPYTACFSLLEDDLPRALEKRLLHLGFGARLLTRTRVPIIKICEKPDASLLDKLREEREKWDVLPNETKYPNLHPESVDDAAPATVAAQATQEEPVPNATGPSAVPANDSNTAETSDMNGTPDTNDKPTVNGSDQHPKQDEAKPVTQVKDVDALMARRRRDDRAWTRERKAGPLDFPKSGIGIQCDINFFNPLGLHNTQMLRCYALCDVRVRPMILFVKAWAKQRKINSSYSGTLSSYGYVLMVLHYLVNIAQPPVLPNLQSPWRPNAQCTPPGATRSEFDGWVIDFWRNEEEITKALQDGQMSSNGEPLGSLLLGFFQYYSSQGGQPQFHWMQEVLSLRSPGGLLSKEEKGWVKAITEEGEGKKVQHRYLFCIEDPFELSHNVARTVTHNGIVAIRDELRRASRILHAIGIGQQPRDGELFAQIVEVEDIEKATEALKLDGAASDPNEELNMTKRKADQIRAMNQHRMMQNRNVQLNGQRPGLMQPKPLNVADNDAFPTLGAAKPKPARNASKQIDDVPSENASEISGDRAKAYLAELQRKKADAHAELTAMGAAESVLGDD